MNMADDVTFRVFRGEPDSEGVPTGKMVDYTVEMDEGMVVLDVIHRIQAEHAPELSCRWNCKAGKCGSCSAEVNGKSRLMCMTRMEDIMEETPEDSPVMREHELFDEFAGPRFFVRLANLEMHPMDEENRLEMIKDDFGIGYCNITRCCTEVCPAGINITDNAIIPLKERVVTEYYDPIAMIAKKMGLRK